MAEDGLVIDMNALIAIHHIQQDYMIVDAGATWRAVLDASLAHGLTPPVLPNYLDLSVGGTLAVGGIGGTISHHGMQTDHVLDLIVVTGDGRELTCSATAHADLFDAVRAGLGQCGVIVRTTLRLIRAPERARRYQLFYPSLGSLTADQRALLTERRFDHLQGAFLPAAAGPKGSRSTAPAVDEKTGRISGGGVAAHHDVDVAALLEVRIEDRFAGRAPAS